MADKNGLDTVFDNVLKIPNRRRTREDTYTISCTKVRHILFLVPGTTDPVNINEHYSNDASMGYWDDTFLEDLELFISDKALGEYDYFDKFRWSGDNNFCSRYAAGLKLTNYIHTYLKTFEAQHLPTFLHFICHSHGGNVIHEFTNIAAANKNFPKHIQVKSIFYLSTPFFKDQAQLNHKILHPNCTIVNVFNKYDLTQRFVANFTMHYMPSLVKIFNDDDVFQKAVKTVKDTPFLKMGASDAAAIFVAGTISSAAYVALWVTLLDLFNTVDKIFERIDVNIQELNNQYSNFITNDIKKEVNTVVQGMRASLTMIRQNLKARLDTALFPDYSVSSLASDIGEGLIDFLYKLNDFLEFKQPKSLDSKFISLLDKILLNQIDKFDDTTYDPSKQLKGKFNYIPVDVTDKDPYDCTKESSNYDKFIDTLEGLEDKYAAAHPSGLEHSNSERIQACKTNTRLSYTTDSNGKDIRSEIIFKLLAQEDYGVLLSVDEFLAWFENLLGSDKFKIVTITRKNIAMYKDQLAKRNDRILHREVETKQVTITKRSRLRIPFLFSIPDILLGLVERYTSSSKTETVKEEKVYSTPFGQAAGGIPYLAVISHSVSRRLLYKEIADILEKQIPSKSIKNAYTIKKCT